MKKKHKNQKFIISTLIFSLLILSAIITIFSVDNKTNEKVIGYISSCGWKPEKTPYEISHIKIPSEFNSVYKAYNALQEKSGFDLSPYKGKTVSRYSYRILNHKSSSSRLVSANILVFKDEIIAADISSFGDDGFIIEITNTADIISD